MPDPTQISQTGQSPEFHPENADAVFELDDFAKIIEEIVGNIDEDVSETKKKDKKKAEEEGKESILSKAKAYGLLESQTVRTAEAKDAHIKQPGPPGGPKLPVPKILQNLREIPSDETGTGNPWLKSSLATDLFLVWFELMPILMQIKLNEAETQADAIILQQEAAIGAAEQALKAKKMEAKKMRLDAIKHFINAGIQIGMAVGTMASRLPAKRMAKGTWRAMKHPEQAARGAYNGLRTRAANMKTGIKNYFGKGPAKEGIAGAGSSWASAKPTNRMRTERTQEQMQFNAQRTQNVREEIRIGGAREQDIGRQQGIHGDEIGGAKGKSQSYLNKAGHHAGSEQMRATRYEQMAQALTSVNEGIFEMMKIEYVLKEGEANYLQQALQHLSELMGRAIQYAEREGKQASDQIGDLIQAMNQFIQSEQAFRIHRGG